MDLFGRLSARDMTVLTAAPRASVGQNPWVELRLSHCAGCGQTNTVFLEQCIETRDARGNRQVTRTPLVQHLLIRKDEVDWLRQHAGR